MDKIKVNQDLLEFLGKGQVFLDEPMSKHTTFKIGGTADFFIKAKSKQDIINTYNYAKLNGIPFYIIGNASNLLVRDNGIRGIVLKNLYDNIEIVNTDDEFVELDVASGTPLGSLVNFALNNSLEGLEFSFGIPGFMGGSVRMNAGAYGGEMKDCVVESLCLDGDGNEKILSFDDHKFVYRNSSIQDKNYIILSTKIRLKKGDKTNIKEKMDANIEARVAKQPTGIASAGSVFKRGNGFITPATIEEAGLKGYKIGGAMVSEKHAGFIVNTGDATAKDVIDLINHIKKVVMEKFQRKLETEVIIIGE